VETPDLSKLRRFSLGTSIILITLLLAKVDFKTPAIISPFGIPLTINKPDLLYIGLLFASIYSMLRYVYYGMIIKASPMHARKLLRSGVPVRARDYGVNFNDFVNDIKKEMSRFFPPFGKYKCILNFPVQEAGKTYKFSVTVPTVLQLIYKIEDFDFLLPIFCSIFALVLYFKSIF
jgi:hypothetical protein